MCPQCYATYLLDDSKKLMAELKEIKTVLSTHKQSIRLLDDLPLEKGIVGVIKRIRKLGEKELSDASFEPKEVKQKLSPSQDMDVNDVGTSKIINPALVEYWASRSRN